VAFRSKVNHGPGLCSRRSDATSSESQMSPCTKTVTGVALKTRQILRVAGIGEEVEIDQGGAGVRETLQNEI